MTAQFWKMFGVVFVVAFAANVGIALLWEQAFPGPLRWDSTTANAAVVALIITYVTRRQQKNKK